MEKTRIGGIMKRSRLAKIGVLSAPDRPGVAAAVLKALGNKSINVPFIAQSVDQHGYGHITLCVDVADLTEALAAAEVVRTVIQAEAVVPHSPVATIGIFGPDFRERPGIAADMFEALASQGINILGISTSISTISCVIDEDRLDDAISALEAAFELP
jgi:aspartate kinase